MKTLRTQSVLIISVLLAVAGLIAYGILFKAMKKSNDHISVLVQSVKQNDEARADTIALKKLIEGVGHDVQKIDAYYIAPEGVVDFIEMIEELGRSAGVVTQISTVSIDTTGASGTTEKLHLAVSFTGSWKSDMHFISLLETIPYDVTFSRVTFIAGAGGVKNTWQGKADIEILKLH